MVYPKPTHITNANVSHWYNGHCALYNKWKIQVNECDSRRESEKNERKWAKRYDLLSKRWKECRTRCQNVVHNISLFFFREKYHVYTNVYSNIAYNNKTIYIIYPKSSPKRKYVLQPIQFDSIPSPVFLFLTFGLFLSVIFFFSASRCFDIPFLLR